ncbi:MAG: 3-keto-5-aminohexanoate cleavage protein [Butyrivibrio sp.]|jgi:3-keto-5-aminohexanoate cleavage enzyme|nr:3-keto-5-aminohexanoate cleavage protein [Butyrivibrio sp.]
MRKVMISVAPVDAADTVNDPEKIAADVYECYRLGASMVHLHCRDAQGRLTPDVSHLEKTIKLIRNKCDIVVEISTGGVSDLTIEERCKTCAVEDIECNSLNVGSVNLGKAVYQNPIDDVEYCVKEILAHGKMPETEVFEIGMLNTLRELDEKFGFTRPMLIAVVLGHKGAMPATDFSLRTMIAAISENFPKKENVLWGITEANRETWDIIDEAVTLGASSIRIGFEDSHLVDRGILAKNNAEIVAQVCQRLKRLDAEPMKTDEVRKILRLSE